MRRNERGKMKRGLNRNGRKKEARAIFLIMKTLLCVSFCFVVRGCYSNRALLSPRSPSFPPSCFSPHRVHPLPLAAAAAHLLFLYYNVRALSGGSDGSGAEAGLPAGCRLERGCQGEIALVMNYIARGYVSLSEEYHHPRSPLSSFPQHDARARTRARFSSPFFFSAGFFLFYFSPLFSLAQLSMENHSCQWSPRALRRKYYTLRSPSMIISLFSILYVLTSP